MLVALVALVVVLVVLLPNTLSSMFGDCLEIQFGDCMVHWLKFTLDQQLPLQLHGQNLHSATLAVDANKLVAWPDLVLRVCLVPLVGD